MQRDLDRKPFDLTQELPDGLTLRVYRNTGGTLTLCVNDRRTCLLRAFFAVPSTLHRDDVRVLVFPVDHHEVSP